MADIDEEVVVTIGDGDDAGITEDPAKVLAQQYKDLEADNAREKEKRQQAEARQAAMERMLQEAEARREAEFQRWEALLEAHTKIEVAEINAKAKEQARPASTQ